MTESKIISDNKLNTIYGFVYFIIESISILILLFIITNFTYPSYKTSYIREMIFLLKLTLFFKGVLFPVIYIFTFIHFNIVRININESYRKILLIHCSVYCVACTIMSIIFPFLGALYYKPINILISLLLVIVISFYYNKIFNKVFSRYYITTTSLEQTEITE